MRHNCPVCHKPLVPSIAMLTETKWLRKSISAERVMHITNTSYIYWKCPVCLKTMCSEIEKEVNSKYKSGPYNYISKEKLLRKKGR